MSTVPVERRRAIPPEVHDLVMPPNFLFVLPPGSTPMAVQLTEVPQFRPGLADPLGITGLASHLVSSSRPW